MSLEIHARPPSRHNDPDCVVICIQVGKFPAPLYEISRENSLQLYFELQELWKEFDREKLSKLSQADKRDVSPGG